MDATNFYTLLGCAPSSSTEQILVEFRRLAVLHHPDKCLDDPEAAGRFACLQQAKEVLTNETQRRLYDDWLGCGLEGVDFKEYKSMRERGGWHWAEAPARGQLMSENQAPATSSSASGASSSQEQRRAEQPRRPHFQGSSSRSELLRRFRNHEL